VLNMTPRNLIAYSSLLCAQDDQQSGNRMHNHLESMIERRPGMATKFFIPGGGSRSVVQGHNHQGSITCPACRMTEAELIDRQPRPGTWPHVHLGTTGSANIVLRDGVARDRLKKEHNVLCVEMEAAGIQEAIPGLVIAESPTMRTPTRTKTGSHTPRQWPLRIESAVADHPYPRNHPPNRLCRWRDPAVLQSSATRLYQGCS
jgi:hypothetical protein